MVKVEQLRRPQGERLCDIDEALEPCSLCLASNLWPFLCHYSFISKMRAVLLEGHCASGKIVTMALSINSLYV